MAFKHNIDTMYILFYLIIGGLMLGFVGFICQSLEVKAQMFVL